MSGFHVSELPDPLYGSCITNTSDKVKPNTSLRVIPTQGGRFIEANIGPIYVGMSAANWKQLIDAVQGFVADPAPTFRLITGRAE